LEVTLLLLLLLLCLQRRGVLPRPGLTLQRVTFNEVTQKAVTEALQQPRQVRHSVRQQTKV
jgi:DNA topoisomerase IA